jgi:hypothetical protein
MVCAAACGPRRLRKQSMTGRMCRLRRRIVWPIISPPWGAVQRMNHRDHLGAGFSRIGQGWHPDLVLRPASQPLSIQARGEASLHVARAIPSANRVGRSR